MWDAQYALSNWLWHLFLQCSVNHTSSFYYAILVQRKLRSTLTYVFNNKLAKIILRIWFNEFFQGVCFKISLLGVRYIVVYENAFEFCDGCSFLSLQIILTNNTRRSSSSGVWEVSFFARRYIVSVASSFTPAKKTTSMSNSEKWSRHLASPPDEPIRLNIHWSESCSVRMTSLRPWR